MIGCMMIGITASGGAFATTVSTQDSVLKSVVLSASGRISHEFPASQSSAQAMRRDWKNDQLQVLVSEGGTAEHDEVAPSIAQGAKAPGPEEHPPSGEKATGALQLEKHGEGAGLGREVPQPGHTQTLPGSYPQYPQAPPGSYPQPYGTPQGSPPQGYGYPPQGYGHPPQGYGPPPQTYPQPPYSGQHPPQDQSHGHGPYGYPAYGLPPPPANGPVLDVAPTEEELHFWCDCTADHIPTECTDECVSKFKKYGWILWMSIGIVVILGLSVCIWQRYVKKPDPNVAATVATDAGS